MLFSSILWCFIDTGALLRVRSFGGQPEIGFSKLILMLSGSLLIQQGVTNTRGLAELN